MFRGFILTGGRGFLNCLVFLCFGPTATVGRALLALSLAARTKAGCATCRLRDGLSPEEVPRIPSPSRWCKAPVTCRPAGSKDVPIFGPTLARGVTVAHQVLVLGVQVQILAGQFRAEGSTDCGVRTEVSTDCADYADFSGAGIGK